MLSLLLIWFTQRVGVIQGHHVEVSAMSGSVSPSFPPWTIGFRCSHRGYDVILWGICDNDGSGLAGRIPGVAASGSAVLPQVVTMTNLPIFLCFAVLLTVPGLGVCSYRIM